MPRLLDGDERGAISVIGLFMLVFMVGILHYVVGTAQAVLMREQLQDTTDAAAMAGAVELARAMNFVVLLNIVMAAILAILIAVRMVQGMASFGMVVAAGLAWPTAGASLTLVPPLKGLYDAMKSVEEAIKPSAEASMEALHAAADGVREFAPEAVPLVGQATLRESPLGLKGIVSSAASTLPIEDAPYSTLCDHASSAVADFAMVPFEKAGIGFGPIDEFVSISGIVRDITKSLASWFCREDGASAPHHSETITVAHPQLPIDDECRAHPDGGACETAAGLHAAAEPEAGTGACNEQADCSPTGPYQSVAAVARQQCDPSTREIRATSYLLRKGTVDYVYTEEGWARRGPPRLQASELRDPRRHGEEQNRPPCGAPVFTSHGMQVEVDPEISSQFNSEPYPDGPTGQFVAVCSKEGSFPRSFSSAPSVGEIRQVEYVEVTHIFGCTERITQEIDFSDAEQDGGGSDEQRPKQVLEDLELGDEGFQVWAITERGSVTDRARGGVLLALWGGESQRDPLSSLRWLGRYGLAQAEFYYEAPDAESREAWMWNMSWRARLRRFAWPEDDDVRQRLDDAAKGGAISRLGELEGVLIDLRSAIAH